MDELDQLESSEWDAGFVAGSQIVVSRIGPYRNIFLRPQQYRRWFFHKVYELFIEEWRVTPLVRQLGGVCQVEVSLVVRFQASLAYVRTHPECLPGIDEHIREKFQPLMSDQAEQVLRNMEDGEWLDNGCRVLERQMEEAIQVSLAMQHVRCRCHAHIQVSFNSAALMEHLTPAGLRLRESYLAMQHCQQEKEAQLRRERLAQEQDAQRLQLEHQAKLLELAKAAREMERQAEEFAAEELREKLRAEEQRLRETMESEARRHQEQLRHEQELQKLKLSGELEELQQRVQTLDGKDDCVKRELELLYLEKQRLILQEEIRDIQQVGLGRSH